MGPCFPRVCVSALVLVVPGLAACQFPAYLWQSSRSDGETARRWTSTTLYAAGGGGGGSSWTSRREMDVTAGRLSVKAVTKAVCLDATTNASVACDRKDVLYRVDCLSAAHSDTYRVRIHAAPGRVNRRTTLTVHSLYCR